MKILIRTPNWVGDTILITPALDNIKKHYQNAYICALAPPWVSPLLAEHPAIDDIIRYDPKGEHKKWTKRLSFARKLGKLGFDMAILFPNSFHAALIVFLAHINKRIGYNTDGRGFLLTQPATLAKDSKSKHLVEYYLDIIRSLDIKISDKKLSLTLDTASYDFAEDFLASRIPLTQPSPPRGEGLGEGVKNLIAIHPGAVKAQKRWHAQRFAEVGKALIKKYDADLILLGSPGELDLLEQIKSQTASSKVIIAKGTTLTQAAALINKCRLFIGNDSGLMHIAAAQDIPIAAIFGPGTPETTAPYMDSSLYRAVLKDVPCRPCRQKFFTECSASDAGKPPCLEGVSVEQVLAAVDELL